MRIKIIYIISLSFLLSICTKPIAAQSIAEAEYYKTPIDDTVKNTNIVVLRNYKLIKVASLKNNQYKVTIKARFQYKIKDLSALQLYSTIYKMTKCDSIWVTLVKADETRKEIYTYTNDEEDEVYYNREPEYTDEQVAVENLAIGDIIETAYQYSYIISKSTYNYTYDTKLQSYPYGHFYLFKNFDPLCSLPFEHELLQKRYTSISSLYEVQLDNSLDLLNVFGNNNYKFEKSVENGVQIYTAKIGQQREYKRETMSYPFVDLPFFKIAVVSKSDQINYAYQFKQLPVSHQHVVALAKNLMLNPDFMKEIVYYRKKGSKTGLKSKKLKVFFKEFQKTFGTDTLSKLEQLNLFHDYITNVNNEVINSQKDFNYTTLLARYCDYIKLNYKILAGVPKYNGNWSNVIHPSELIWGLYIIEQGDTLYINKFDNTSNIYQRESVLSNTTVVYFDLSDKANTFQTMIYPTLNYSKNVTLYEVQAYPSDSVDNDRYSFDLKLKTSGTQRFNLADNLQELFYIESPNTPSPYYGLVDADYLYNHNEWKDTGVIFPEFRRVSNEFSRQVKLKDQEKVENYLKVDYQLDQLTLDSLITYENGLIKDNESALCSLRMVFKANGFLEKTSSSLKVLHLGKIIGDQLEMSRYDINERQTSLNNSNQRQISWKISIKLPENYEPLNLKNFNKNFKNMVGQFISSCTYKDNTLLLEIDKIYAFNHLPKENYIDLLEFLQQANYFFQADLLLKNK